MNVVGDGIQAGQAEPPKDDDRPDETRISAAQRTREALIEAAYGVFSRDGFLDARIGDIAAGAGVAHATFYTYFASKEAIFQELVMRLGTQVADEQVPVTERDDPWQQIEFGNRSYLRGYREHAALIATMEQVATFNNEIRRLRREIRRPFTERNAAAIRRWQAAGLADPELDPLYTATALGAMVERFMYLWFVLGEQFDEEQAVQTLTQVWVRALGLGRRPGG